MWNIVKEICGNLKRLGNSLLNFGVVLSVIVVRIFFLYELKLIYCMCVLYCLYIFLILCKLILLIIFFNGKMYYWILKFISVCFLYCLF